MLTLLRNEIAQFLSPLIELPVAQIESALEIPKKLEHGHLAFPVFQLAKTLRKAPPVIAKEVSEKAMAARASVPGLKDIQPAGGYLNFTFENARVQSVLADAVASQGEQLGYSKVGAGKTVVIDYSSPNVAKPMHIGHLRATVIGQAIRNLVHTQGFNAIGLNHIGDWGVQFGKLAWAYENWGHEYDLKNAPFQSLYTMYVRFHAEAETNKELDAKGSDVFRRLEEGDAKIEALWKHIVEISMDEYQKVYELLNVKHDLVRGESFYNDRLKNVEDLLNKKGLLVESQGAMVVPLGDDMPPCLIRKSDGASLYATRDIASAIFRHDELGASINLYVVGMEQTLHFRQVIRVLELMGYDWAKNFHHLSFGRYQFKDGQMSTRKGRTIFLEDVVNKAIEMVEKIITEKNPDLPNRTKIAQQVGTGAIIFNDLVNDRVKNVEFDWDRVLDFQGDSGPYLQYAHVRCKSLLAKYAKPVQKQFTRDLVEPEERELMRVLMNYQDVLAQAAAQYRPNVLAQYLLDVTAAFNHFYHKHQIMGSDAEADRMLLVELTRQVLKLGLGVLNIQAPEAM